jgi:hypothetical protein
MLLALGLWAAGASCALAREPGVRDDAGLFSAQAVDRANVRINEIKWKFHQNVFIDTFAELPAAERDQVKGLSTRSRDRRIAEWAAERAAEGGPSSVNVIILENPRQVHVIAGDQTQERAFTASDANALRQFFVRRLGRRHDPNQALLDGVAEVHHVVDYNLDESVNWPLIVGALAAILGLWLAVVAWQRWSGRTPTAGEPAAAAPPDAPARPEPPVEPESADVAHGLYADSERRHDDSEYY